MWNIHLFHNNVKIFHDGFNYFMVTVSPVPRQSQWAGPSADLVQPTALVWTWSFRNMATPNSEDLTELFCQLIKYLAYI